MTLKSCLIEACINMLMSLSGPPAEEKRAGLVVAHVRMMCVNDSEYSLRET